MTKTILVAIDVTSKASWQLALPEAVKLARLNGAALHVLYVEPDTGSPLVSGFLPKDFAKTALARANAELVAIANDQIPQDLGAKLHVKHGTVHREIIAKIKDLNADLVIMASLAPDRVREFLIGSQADRVVRRSPVSVLVVRG
ncbi:universal stress protein (plasmid) [Pseudorhodobacter turbinis]|uniref:Universal stress protein n=1 Tax=Pseudorhodobacter turbinis TaxID=2500533 RepID=A0A4P8EKI3_9RHOB|nr:universal stress protein [Pseudorhodobacter turbinis]QCO57567.1 universal stress protein [Pseudorhodobacter turbinis]